MKKLIYIEDDFISSNECQKFIDLSLNNQGNEMPYGDDSRGGDTYLTTVDWKNHGAVYYGGDVDTTVPSLDHDVVVRINNLCQSFDSLSLIHISEPTRRYAIGYGGVWV